MIAHEVRTGHTWQMAEHASDERGVGKSVGRIKVQLAACSHARSYPPSQQPVPDALDELCHTMHRVAVVRHDAAHAPPHVHQPPVAAREQQQPALALAVISQRHLRESQVARVQHKANVH